MRIPGRKWVRDLLRPVSSRLFPGAVILGYHRIADVKWDPLELAVGIEEFQDQIKVLVSKREIVGLSELVRRANTGQPLERCAAITFDDGYQDVVENALPILQAAGAPATVFVATGFVDRDFWWGQVAASLKPGSGNRQPLMIDDGSGYVREFEDLIEPYNSGKAARQICHDLRAGDTRRIGSVLDQIKDWGGEPNENLTCGKPLTQAQIATLAGAGTMEIGAHTVTHGCLGEMSPDRQKTEIQQSRETLQAIVGRPIKNFSYPNGSFSPDTADLVRRSGFECACTSTQGLFRMESNPFLMPRVWVPNMKGAAFENWLKPWIGKHR